MLRFVAFVELLLSLSALLPSTEWRLGEMAAATINDRNRQRETLKLETDRN